MITSNFEKLRFYINNAVDYEEFNLFTLTLSEFEIFYLCLAKDNILANKPLAIKEASIVEEENITKKFYADYSLFKRELYRDLVKQNRNNVMLMELPDKTSKLILFKKSQKLIDRFLFILIAEDKGLLAPNSIYTGLKEWKALADWMWKCLYTIATNSILAISIPGAKAPTRKKKSLPTMVDSSNPILFSML